MDNGSGKRVFPRDILCVAAAAFIAAGCGPGDDSVHAGGNDAASFFPMYRDEPLNARYAGTGFPRGDSSYNAIIRASDGAVYFAVSSHLPDTHVHFFRYDPVDGVCEEIADIGEIVGETPGVAVPQGKIHTEIFEQGGRLYFATHAGFYSRGGTDTLAPYPGGHFMSYDLATGAFEDYGIAVPEEGLVTLAMDRERMRLYAFTWPSGIFVSYDLAAGAMKSYGEAVGGHSYADGVETGIVPRSLGVDPRDGSVYWWNMDETVVRYRVDSDAIEPTGHNLSRPVLNVRRKGVGENYAFWRSTRFNARDGRFYCVSWFGEHLYSYDPRTGEIEVIDRIAAAPNRRSGNVNGHASIAFDLSDDGRYIYYAPRGNGIHIVTYDLDRRRYTDHGAVVLDDGRRPTNNDGIEIGGDGSLYLVCIIPVDDLSSPEADAIISARYAGTPRDSLKSVAEAALVVVPDPLGRPVQGEGTP